MADVSRCQLESADQRGRQGERDGVHDQVKKTEGEDRDGECQDDENGPDDRIHETEDQRRQRECAPGSDGDARDNHGRQPERDGNHQPVDEEAHGADGTRYQVPVNPASLIPDRLPSWTADPAGERRFPHAFKDAEHLFLTDDQVLLAFDFDFRAGELPEENPLASLDIERDNLRPSR